MRRLIISCVIAVAGVSCAVAVASGPGAASGSTTSSATTTPAPPPPASLTAFSCQRSAVALNRLITITAVIRHITGTSKLSLRFRLLRKSQGRKSFVNVSYGDLGKWKTNPTLGPQPGDVWQLRKPVADLPGPATYRFRVSFRWTGSDGSVLQLTTLTSRLCHQP